MKKLFTVFVLITLTQLTVAARSADAQLRAGSRLLLPHFEVSADGVDVTTHISVTNAADRPVEVRASIYTNWGIPILETTFDLQAHALLTADLHDWLVVGELPDRTLGREEIDHVVAALSGERSPLDGLFYSEAIPSLHAGGYLIFAATGAAPEAGHALLGDFLIVESGDRYAQGLALVNLDPDAGCEKLCVRHGFRYLSGSFDAGTDIFLWTRSSGNPSSNGFFPDADRIRTEIVVYDDGGREIDVLSLLLLPSQVLRVSDLSLAEDFGWLDVRTDRPSFIAVRYGALNRFSVGLRSFCIPERQPPRLRLEKRTNGVDADVAPGPAIPHGAAVTWEYEVSNRSDVRLSDLDVSDDRGVVVDCPGTVLEAGETMICTGRGTAICGDYRNVGRVTATAPDGSRLADDDPSHYRGSASGSIDLEKLTNGHDADRFDQAPLLGLGEPVVWTYAVANTGDATLVDVEVFDDREGPVKCPRARLAAGETMTCTLEGVATAAAYANLGTVTAVTEACATPVRDEDPSHYRTAGRPCFLDLEKHTNGEDADLPTGPQIPAGGTVTWEYFVTNTMDPQDPQAIAAENVSVVDDREGVIACPQTSLAPGETMTCTRTGTALLGQYANVAEATAGNCAADSDPSHYFGACREGSIDIEKATNGQDADVGPGPAIPAGDPVQWTYVIANTGAVELVDVSVDDDREGPVCQFASLAPGATETCTLAGVAVEGQYRNTATVTALDSCDQSEVSDSDDSHYHNPSCVASIDLEKSTNGEDADLPPGVTILPGEPVLWEYVVTNSGPTALDDVELSDDREGTITCPSTSLEPGESMTCTHAGVAACGAYQNIATVVALSSCDSIVSDFDLSHYSNDDDASIDLEKLTNGEDADSAPGPFIPAGDAVTWDFVVTNDGDAPLYDVVVFDDLEGEADCPRDTLAPGESMTCTLAGIAACGPYQNRGKAVAASACGTTVSDSDFSHYTSAGGEVSIDVEKHTNGQDADFGPGPEIPAGSPVTWDYIVTNTGTRALDGIALVDDREGTVTCPATTLAAGQSMTCTRTGTAIAGEYWNLATVEASGSGGPGCPVVTVIDDDPSHYHSPQNPWIKVEKYTLDTAGVRHDADQPNGPTIPYGETVRWEYDVSNDGDVRLTDILLTDNREGVILCPLAALDPGQTMTCLQESVAVCGAYRNVATVRGTPPAGTPVTDTDPSNYWGSCTPKIDIEKATVDLQGVAHDADVATGPAIPYGEPVSWQYVVTNTGNVGLTSVSVWDDKLMRHVCQGLALEPGESTTCTAEGVAGCGQYRNVGMASALPPTGIWVNDTDPSHYYGDCEPGLDLEKLTRDPSGQLHDADQAPGPAVVLQTEIEWLYVVTNTGTVTVHTLKVIDDREGTVSCPQSSLSPGQSMTCTASGASTTCGQYQNLGTVTGYFQNAQGQNQQIADSDPSHYFCDCTSGLNVEKATNGQDADSAPGPSIPAGEPVAWTYLVTNFSQVTLSNITVSDDVEGPVGCPQTSLAPGETMTCTILGTATCGQYANLGIATAQFQDAGGTTITISDVDGSHYLGECP